MNLLKLCRYTLSRCLLALVIISSLLVPPGFCQETEDSQVFINGFNSYQQKDYIAAIDKMNEVLKKYPDTPLRDMALFWLARAYFKSGNQQEAARYMSQFSKEYPDNPLKTTVEEDLLNLVVRYEKGEKLAVGSAPDRSAEKQVAAQKAQAEKERQAQQARAEQERLALQAEQQRLAKAKAEQELVATEKAEQARLAKAKAEEERIAADRAEQARLAVLKAEEDRKAAAEEARLASLSKDQQRTLAEKVEQERVALEKIAAEKAEQERLASLKVEEERKQAEQQRLALLKVEEERKLSEQAEQQSLEREKAEKIRIAALESDIERKTAEAAEQQRLAQEKNERERVAEQKAEQLRLEALKAEEVRLAEEQAAIARVVAVKAEKERLAAVRVEEELRLAEKSQQDQLAARKAEEDRVAAAAKAEEERVAAFKVEEERRLAEKAQHEQLAAQKADEERSAAAAAEAARLAVASLEQERLAAERAAAKAEADRVAAARQEDSERAATARAEEQRLVSQREAEEKVRVEKLAMREKAIQQYKSIIDNYPGSRAASAAAAKLQELGIAVAMAPQIAAVEQKPAELENSQVLRFEVAQYAGFEFNLQPRSQQSDEVARRINIPFEITNRGNGSDSFYLESGFSPEFNPSFASAAAPDQSINQTPVMAPNEIFRGFVNLTVPANSIDGLRISHPVKAASRLASEASQSRQINLTAAAPLLRVVLKTDKTQALPGDKVAYRLAVLNVGSTAAQNVSLRLSFPPQMEPLDYAAAGFKQEMKAALVLDGLQINSGESKDYTVTFQLKDDSLAGQELLCRAELINKSLNTTAAFMSNPSYVQPHHGIAVRSGAERLVVIPGQSIIVPFVLTNTGNLKEKFKIVSSLKGLQEAIIFQDINRDGVRQSSEPVITEIGPLEPKEEISIALDVKTAKNASDGTEGNVQVSFIPEGDATRSGEGSTRLVYSRPVLQMNMAARDGRLKPGEVASFDLTISNQGSNIARVVELQSVWPEQLELVATEPANSSTVSGIMLWKFNELGAGEKRNIKVSFRVKAGTGVGTNIQVKNVLKYEDQLGNRY